MAYGESNGHVTDDPNTPNISKADGGALAKIANY